MYLWWLFVVLKASRRGVGVCSFRLTFGSCNCWDLECTNAAVEEDVRASANRSLDIIILLVPVVVVVLVVVVAVAVRLLMLRILEMAEKIIAYCIIERMETP